MENKLLRIDKLELENYRCFDRLEITFDKQLTVLVASNGKGKTAILDAIAVAFGTFVNATGYAKGAVFHREDVRLIRARETQSKEMEAQYPLTLKCVGLIQNEQASWNREFRTPKSATTTKDTKPLVEYGKSFISSVVNDNQSVFPAISYYGTGRLWATKKLTKNKKKHSTSRLSGYIDALDPQSSYKAFAEWFEYVCKSEFETIMEAHESSLALTENEFSKMKQAVQRAVNIVISHVSGWRNIIYRQKADTIVATHETEGEIPVAQLSDGIRSVIGLVADIAYRAIKLNPHLGEDAAKQTPGLILIDEVDMHLHPAWQQTILSDLIKAFPLMQFIVTTHSPQVLTTVKREQIRLISGDEAHIPPTHSWGEQSTTLLADIMGVSPWPPLEIVKKRKRYQRLVDSKEYDTEEALKLRSELKEVYGKYHELFLHTDMLIRRFEALRQAKPS